MAFQQNNINALSEIPPLVAAFAAAQGWIVGGTSANPTLKHPTYPAGLTFTLGASTDGTLGNARQILSWTAPGGYLARLSSPRRGSNQSVPVQVAPTKVMMFASMLPQPHIAIVVAYGFNLYRHLYLGYLEKQGSFDGGEVLCGSYARDLYQSGTSAVSWKEDNGARQFLFGGNQNGLASGSSGSARIIHANNATTRREFRQVVNQPDVNAVPTDVILGGFGDGINDGYIARGKSSYAGSDILVPVNLYIGNPGNTYRPVGHPPSVRLINMKDIDPEATVEIGGEEWMIIPQFKKSTAVVVNMNSSFPLDETSYHLGLAYKKD